MHVAIACRPSLGSALERPNETLSTTWSTSLDSIVHGQGADFSCLALRSQGAGVRQKSTRSLRSRVRQHTDNNALPYVTDLETDSLISPKSQATDGLYSGGGGNLLPPGYPDTNVTKEISLTAPTTIHPRFPNTTNLWLAN